MGLAEMNGWRGSMEDAHVVHTADDWGYFGILDGHGGEVCSAWCARRLHEKLEKEGCPADDATAKRMVLAVDAEFLATQQRSGSTAAMCIVRPPTGAPGGRRGKYQLHVINAGDSRVLLSRADGTIVDGGGTDQGLTTDHKPDWPSERERIYRCGGTVEEAAGGVYRVNGDLAVSRGFGDAEYKKTGPTPPTNSQEDRPVTCNPEMGHFECEESDFLLIVCDGVSEGAFPNPEVCQLAAKVLQETNGDAALACEAICHRAVETNSKDNISAMIVLMGGPGSKQEGNHVGWAGSGAIEMGKNENFNPGSVASCDNSGYTTAYVAMCARAGVTFGHAVEMRYNVLLARQGSPEAEGDDMEELALIGTPVGAEGTEERRSWFEGWAAEREAGGGGDDGGDPMAALSAMAAGGGGGPGGQAQMMQMLMGMMQQRGGAGDMPGMPGMGGMEGMEGMEGIEDQTPEDGRRVQVSDLTTLKAAVAGHPALQWDERMSTLASAEGIVKKDDPTDGTTHIRFPAPVGVVAWLPTVSLTDLDDGCSMIEEIME